jgi:uncharacterized protein YPO0396
MSSLAMFDNSNEGFRLHYVEIYNWGTFGDEHNRVYRINPNGNNSLLTGANGSGKTTLVDALVTLLVPSNKRFYNQSSGTDLKKERDETSYVLGYYGKTQSDDATEASIQQLRSKNDYSVILAYFYNEGIQQDVTLAQVRWFSNNELKRAYIVSPNKLSIAEHFTPFDSKGEWRKRLKALNKTEIYDSFTNYATEFSRIFGLRSQKALSLFSQTIGIKVLGNLNEFIRANMLEEPNTEEEFNKLKENYDDLIAAHRAIEKAQDQLSMLEPIVKNADEFDRLEKEATELEEIRQLVPAYFATSHNEILDKQLNDKKAEMEAQKDKLETSKLNTDQLRSSEVTLNTAKSGTEISGQLSMFDEKVNSLELEKDRKQGNSNRYGLLAKKVNYEEDVTEKSFTENLKASRDRYNKIDVEISDLEEKIIDSSVDLNILKDKFNDLSQNLESYTDRKNQIPPENIRIRQGILDYIEASEEELPFAGELMRVREDEKEWEPAIESLLHNFGLRLLVPEKYYREVNKYINETNIRGRIVYHKIDEKRPPNIFYEEVDNSVASKIEIKPKTQFRDWIEAQLQHQFDYICCDTLEDFNRHRRAITINRLKKDADRHEKDDRLHVVSEDKYILGWDNKEKLKYLRGQLQVFDTQIKEQNIKIETHRNNITRLSSEKEIHAKLLTFERFSEIDWKSTVINIEKLNQEKTNLIKGSDGLSKIDSQLKTVQQQIREKIDEQEGIIEVISNLKRDVQEIEKSINDNLAILQHYEGVDLKEQYVKLLPYLDKYGDEISSENITKVRSSILGEIANLVASKSKLRGELAQTLIRQMGQYKQPNAEVLKKYPGWEGDTINLEARITYLPQYKAAYDRILKEDLPKFKERFRKYLNESIIEKLTDFKTALESQFEGIMDSIDELNMSLFNINFSLNPPTYIQLVMKPNTDVQIRQFRIELDEWQPDMSIYELTKDDSILEESFKKIQKLIQELTADENFRKKVTDVRNWLDFSAKEFYREDNVQFKFYESSSGLSGGEKAQLSYTILGAAIAYQFGINMKGKQPKSFRFIAVDEAFSKLDPDKSIYLMELCKQLHLQLLVVTPLDKIHVVEPFISSCHYVENKNKRNSVVYDLTIDQYYEKKKEFEKLALQE